MTLQRCAVLGMKYTALGRKLQRCVYGSWYYALDEVCSPWQTRCIVLGRTIQRCWSSSVQDVTYALGKSHMHSTPQFSSRCYLCAGQIPYVLHPSVQFKMLPMRWANPICTPPLSSVEDVTYALGKSHIHSTPQFSSRCYLYAGQIP